MVSRGGEYTRSRLEAAQWRNHTEQSQHLEDLSKVEGYLRSTRYKLVFAHTNAQLEKLKGSSGAEAPPPQPATWLTLHEFSTETMDAAKVQAATNTEWTTRILQNSKIAEFHTYSLAKAHGKGEWFHGGEL